MISILLNSQEPCPTSPPPQAPKTEQARKTPVDCLSPGQLVTLGGNGCASGATGFSLGEPVESGKWAALIGHFQHPPGSRVASHEA